MKRSILLPADAIINLILGIILLLYPLGIAERIGIPLVENSFYPGILGAVLAGIGIALLLEWSERFPGLVGSGLGGAVSINLCDGLALIVCLICGNLNIPLRGHIILWTLAVIIFGISFFELLFHLKRPGSAGPDRT